MWCQLRAKCLPVIPQWWPVSKSWCSPVSSWSRCSHRWWRDSCICWTTFMCSPGQGTIMCFRKTASSPITHASTGAVTCSASVCPHPADSWRIVKSRMLRPSALYTDSEYFRESVRHEIRMARERFSGQALRDELSRIQKRLDSVELLTPDIVMNLLLSYRDIQVSICVCFACFCLWVCKKYLSINPLMISRL